MMQPDSPAELGSKIYGMMALALGGRWGRTEEEEGDAPVEAGDSNSSEEATATEPEVYEASEVIAESDPWTTD